MRIKSNRRMDDNAPSFAVENYYLLLLAQHECELLLDVSRRHTVYGATG